MRKLIAMSCQTSAAMFHRPQWMLAWALEGNAGGGVGVAADVFVRLAVGFGDVVAVTVVVRLRLFADCC